MSNNSIWFAVDEDGSEFAYTHKPKRDKRRSNGGYFTPYEKNAHKGDYTCLQFPISIQAITGRTLTWEDEPLQWKPGEVCFVNVYKDKQGNRHISDDDYPTYNDAYNSRDEVKSYVETVQFSRKNLNQ